MSQAGALTRLLEHEHLLAGATDAIGMPIVRLLVARGHRV
jgi:nucleoside-diphosphate-sugar epimerase